MLCYESYIILHEPISAVQRKFCKSKLVWAQNKCAELIEYQSTFRVDLSVSQYYSICLQIIDNGKAFVIKKFIAGVLIERLGSMK